MMRGMTATQRRGAMALGLAMLCAAAGASPEGHNMHAIALPPPRLDSSFSVERALQQRRTVRDFDKDALALADLGQLLWAAQGITRADGLRTAPSAGALYPLELIVVAGNVSGLAPGVYGYASAGHALSLLAPGDRRAAVAAAARGERWMEAAPAVIVFCAVPSRTSRKYGTRGMQYIYIETGHAAQNVFLEAQALGLGAAAVGAFDEAQLGRVLQLSPGMVPLYLVPVGVPRDTPP
jgi:SagB-type dehydrogenase family enzyme